jgi:hypothetical protein
MLNLKRNPKPLLVLDPRIPPGINDDTDTDELYAIINHIVFNLKCFLKLFSGSNYLGDQKAPGWKYIPTQYPIIMIVENLCTILLPKSMLFLISGINKLLYYTLLIILPLRVKV